MTLLDILKNKHKKVSDNYSTKNVFRDYINYLSQLNHDFLMENIVLRRELRDTRGDVVITPKPYAHTNSSDLLNDSVFESDIPTKGKSFFRLFNPEYRTNKELHAAFVDSVSLNAGLRFSLMYKNALIKDLKTTLDTTEKKLDTQYMINQTMLMHIDESTHNSYEKNKILVKELIEDFKNVP